MTGLGRAWFSNSKWQTKQDRVRRQRYDLALQWRRREARWWVWLFGIQGWGQVSWEVGSLVFTSKGLVKSLDRRR
jgi:hypothetical protein